MKATSQYYASPGLELQTEPRRIYLTSLPGRWLLTRTTPSWRIQDPEKGFQRVVRDDRAKEIAVAVLDQHRTFPNAIVLATDQPSFEIEKGSLKIPTNVRFLVVDGQHRLWAQRFSQFDANYACLIHTDLSEVEMAWLFLEINDNQKRVPSSLRWDLVRLVMPTDDPPAVAAAEAVYLLATEQDSPLFQRIDLTGEQSEIYLKQGSLAPGLRPLFSSRSPLSTFTFEDQYQVVKYYFIAMRTLDSDRWGRPESPIYKARVIRALLRLLTDILRTNHLDAKDISPNHLLQYLERIDMDTLDLDRIRALQGNAGIKNIYDLLHRQVILEHAA